MAIKLPLSQKHLQVDKANARMLLAVAGASFITVFSLIAGKALLGQSAYQNRVISGKSNAEKQLKANANAVNQLVSSYQTFVSAKTNIIGGLSAGTGEKDGDNAKIILDALPSKYDFPALTTSLEKLLNDKNFKIEGISGTDDEIAQADNGASANPQPLEIPFQVTISGNYTSVQNLIAIFEHSIRPITIKSLSITGDENNMRIGISAKTYYQPEKSLKITKKVVK